MNLIGLVLKGHSRAIKDQIVRYVGGDPHRFSELVSVFLAGPYRVTQRASWPLSYCVEKHPELIKPHLKAIINNLKTPGIHDSVKRNTIRLLQFIDIPKSQQGVAANICFDFLSNPKEPIAVRVFSMTVLSNIARDQTALRNEVRIVIEDQMPYASAAFRSRGRKVIEELKSL
jgi:hypothetical protein